jgi:hypothetical protein
MSEDKKFTEEELKSIKEIQSKYFQVQQELGQSAINKLRLLQQIEFVNSYEEELTKKFGEIQEGEKKFIEEITKKYGAGVLDPKTGVYKLNTETDK